MLLSSCFTLFLSVFTSLTCILQGLAPIQQADDITYEWLEESSRGGGESDHIAHFKKIFSLYKTKAFLQMGATDATKYFLDTCRKVISVEFVTHGCGPDNIRKYMHLYREFSNWIPLIYFTGFKGDTDWAQYKYLGSDSVYKAVSYQDLTCKNYALIDDFYLHELEYFLKNVVRYNNANIAFVDGSLYLRGDLVQILFNKVPLIIAHDTKSRADGIAGDKLGFSRIVCPENYEEIYLPYGKGTTVWVERKTELTNLSLQLKNYAAELNTL